MWEKLNKMLKCWKKNSGAPGYWERFSRLKPGFTTKMTPDIKHLVLTHAHTHTQRLTLTHTQTHSLKCTHTQETHTHTFRHKQLFIYLVIYDHLYFFYWCTYLFLFVFLCIITFVIYFLFMPQCPILLPVALSAPLHPSFRSPLPFSLSLPVPASVQCWPG